MALPLSTQITVWLRSLNLSRTLADAWQRFETFHTSTLHTAARLLMDSAAHGGGVGTMAAADLMQAFTGEPPTSAYKHATDEQAALNTDPLGYLAARMTDFINDPDTLKLQSALGEIPLRMILRPIEESIASGEDDPIGLAGRMQGTMAAISLSLHALGIVTEVAGLGQIEGVNELAKSLSEIYGAGELTHKLLEPLFDAGINEPATRYFNKKYRPGRLSIGEADALFFEHAIDELEYREILEVHGLRDHDIALKIEQVLDEIPLGTILQAYHLKQIDAAEAIDRIRQKGFRPSDAAFFLAVEDGSLVEEQYTSAIRIAKKAYRDQLIDADRFRFLLRAARAGEDRIALEVATGDLDIADAKRTLGLGQIEAAYKSHVLADTEARHYLGEMDVPLAAQNVLLATWNSQIAPRALSLNAGVIEEAYIDGLLTRSEAANKLRELGWSADNTNLMLDVAQRSKITPTRAIGEAEILSAYSRKLLNRAQAIAKLVGIDYKPDDAATLVQWAEIRPDPPSKILSESQVVKLFELGTFSQAVAIERLVRTGYSRADAALALEAAVNKISVPTNKVKTLTAAEVVKAVGLGAFTVLQAFDKLVEMGFSEPDAIIYLELHDVDVSLLDVSRIGPPSA